MGTHLVLVQSAFDYWYDIFLFLGMENATTATWTGWTTTTRTTTAAGLTASYGRTSAATSTVWDPVKWWSNASPGRPDTHSARIFHISLFFFSLSSTTMHACHGWMGSLTPEVRFLNHFWWLLKRLKMLNHKRPYPEQVECNKICDTFSVPMLFLAWFFYVRCCKARYKGLAMPDLFCKHILDHLDTFFHSQKTLNFFCKKCE